MECHLTLKFAPACPMPSHTLRAAKLLQQSEQECLKPAVTADLLEVVGKIARGDTPLGKCTATSPTNKTVVRHGNERGSEVDKFSYKKSCNPLLETLQLKGGRIYKNRYEVRFC